VRAPPPPEAPNSQEPTARRLQRSASCKQKKRVILGYNMGRYIWIISFFVYSIYFGIYIEPKKIILMFVSLLLLHHSPSPTSFEKMIVF
jgi:hypothetical protein